MNSPADLLEITLVTSNGAGCPAGTVALALAPDRESFTVTFTQYTAVAGVGALPTDFRKNCQLNAVFLADGAYTYAVGRQDSRGTWHVEPGAAAVVRQSHYYAGATQAGYATHQFAGPLDGEWQATDEVAPESLIFPPCGEERNLNLNTELRVSAGTSDTTATTSSISLNSVEGAASMTYHLVRKECGS